MPDDAAKQAPTDPALLRAVVDKITAMLAYWDTEQRCRFANRAYERWFGVSPESLIGHHISELLGPIYELNRPYIEGALRGEPQEFEREIPDPKGGPSRHSLANYIPDIVGGVVRGFFVLVTDISEIKRAQLALAESEARFSGIVSISADAIIAVDEQQRISIFNAAAERIFGYAQADVIGRELDILIPEHLRARHREHIARFIAATEVSREMGRSAMPVVGLRKNGEEFPAEASISRLQLKPRTLLTVALRDITERRRLETEQRILVETGELLSSSLDIRKTLEMIARLIVRHVADFCVVDLLDEDARLVRLTVTHADPAKADACAALARIPVDRNHTIARSVLETRQPQIVPNITDAFVDATAQDDAHRAALRALGPRSALVVPLSSAESVLGAIVFGSVKPYRYSERDLGLATELARRAALALQNAHLYEAARRATQARDDVLGIVAHDVRAPLNSILLAAELLQRRLPDADAAARENVASIVRSVERANHLIQDLLDVRLIEAGALSLERSRIAVAPLLSDLIANQRLQASARSVALFLELDDDLPDLAADPHRVMQVFENLIGNALKFTPKGGAIVVAGTTDADSVLFSVQDTGSGIAPENLPHVFDRFWQATRTARQGAGLGLAICKGIVEAHGGRLWVESSVGRGTTFFFTIPFALPLARAMRADANSAVRDST